jgi:transcriptional regulator GlxA family with amidase domain
MDTAPRHVGILAYEGCFGAEVFGFADLLAIANRAFAGAPDPFRVSIVSPCHQTVKAAGRARIAAQRIPRTLDLLVVPGFDLHPDDDLDRRLARLGPEIAAVRAAARRGTRIASICVGAFLAGEAGRLDGRTCTTAWMFADVLAERYPHAAVMSDQLIIEHDDIVTSAAFSSAHDLALRLIGQLLGEPIAKTIARITLTSEHRDRQSPYIDPTLVVHQKPPFAQSVTVWLDTHLDEPYDLADLARRCNVSTRTLLRRFRAEMGISPLRYLQRARINEAKRLLIASDLRLGAITRQVGYSDTATFRRMFTDHVGIAPSQFRSRFAHVPIRSTVT